MSTYKTRLVEQLDNRSVLIFTDDRGQVADFRSFHVEGLHVVTMQPGAVRGNHVHDRDEVICVEGGNAACEIIAEEEVSEERENFVVERDLTIYRIKAGTKHIVRNMGTHAFYLVCFYIKPS